MLAMPFLDPLVCVLVVVWAKTGSYPVDLKALAMTAGMGSGFLVEAGPHDPVTEIAVSDAEGCGLDGQLGNTDGNSPEAWWAPWWMDDRCDDSSQRITCVFTSSPGRSHKENVL